MIIKVKDKRFIFSTFFAYEVVYLFACLCETLLFKNKLELYFTESFFKKRYSCIFFFFLTTLFSGLQQIFNNDLFSPYQNIVANSRQ